MNITISKGNSKLGRIPNISLTPIKSCVNCSACRKDCYALKSYKQYPNVKKAWDKNLKLARTNPADYFDQIDTYLIKHKPKYFRWHVAGDILDQNYLNSMIALAHNNPKTRFLAYTKNFDLDFSYMPYNLTIRFSIFPTMALHRDNASGSLAWLQDGTEDRIPSDAFKCGGSCVKCKKCWNSDKDVYFIKH